MLGETTKWHGKYYVVLGMIAGLLVMLLPASAFASGCGNLSGDGPYDQAACVQAGAPAFTGSIYSGDDAYDPAAGGLAVKSLAFASRAAAPAVAGRYSGDNAYDPAAWGSRGEEMRSALAGDIASADCGLTAPEVARRIAARIPGGFSGDDAYDQAAGGIPELSVASFAAAAGEGARCVPARLGSVVLI